MLSQKEQLDIIMKHDAKDILRAMFESLDGYRSLPLIEYTRKQLETLWHDGMWKYENRKDWDPVIEKLFTFRGTIPPEDEFHQCTHVFGCNLCGAPINELEERPLESRTEHISSGRCRPAQILFYQCNSPEEFRQELLNCKGIM